MGSTGNPPSPSTDPWSRLLEIAEYLQEQYSPDEGADTPARCDVDMIIQAVTAAQWALGEVDKTTDGQQDWGTMDPQAIRAITALLGVLHAVLRGLLGDMRELASGIVALAEEAAAIRGPDQ